MMLGVDLINENHMDKMLGPKKKRTNQEKLEEALGPDAGGVGDLVAGGDAKIEDLEAPPAWEADPNDPPDSPIDISSRSVVVCACFCVLVCMHVHGAACLLSACLFGFCSLCQKSAEVFTSEAREMNVS